VSVTPHTGLPPTSPYEIQFGQAGTVFTVTIRFHEDTRLLISVQLQRDAAASNSTLIINEVAIGTVNPGGSLLVNANKLASLGFETFEDIGSIGLRE
jgi:hypothetical protein